MKRVKWVDRQPGDIFLSAVPSEVGHLIYLAERETHPEAPSDFEVTHAGICSFNDMVVEAWMNLSGEDSVAAINPASKYGGLDDYLEVWRPAIFVPDALARYVADKGPERYGALNLVGFEWRAIVKQLTGREVDNPIEISEVCSQGALDFLGNYLAPLISPLEAWAFTAAHDEMTLRDCDPLALRLMLLAHEML